MRGIVRNGGRLAAACAVLLLALTAAGTARSASEKPVGFAVTISGSAQATTTKYQPLVDYLSKKTGKPFELRFVRTYEDILDLMRSGEADAGVFGSVVGSDAFLHKQVIPVARPEKGRMSTYRAYLIARKDGGAKRIEDLKGRTFDSNSGSASVGGFFPRKLLKDWKFDFGTFFSGVTASPEHETVIHKVLNRDVDCGAVKDTVFENIAASNPRVKKELVILATSQKFPDGNVMLRMEVSAEFARAVREALLGMEADKGAKPALEALGADRFIPSSEKELESLGRAVKAVEKK